MAINDNAGESDFQQLTQDISRRRRFGFTQGAGAQTVQGNYPSGPPQPQRQFGAQATGVQPNYGFPQSNYNVPQGPGVGSQILSNLAGRFNRGGGGGGGSRGSAAAPASSRTLKRGSTDNSISMTDSSTGITVNFGNQSAGFSTGDIFGAGAQVDKSSNVDASSRNVTMGGGQASTQSGAPGTAAPKRARTGGKVAGQTSNTPAAQAARQRRANAKASGAPAGNKSTQTSADTNVVSGVDLSSGQRKNMFNNPPSGSGGGPVSVGSNNRVIQAQGENIDASQDVNPTTVIKKPPTPPKGGGPNLPPPPPPTASGSATPTSPPPPSAGGSAVPAGAPATSGATQQTAAPAQRKSGKKQPPSAKAAPAATPAPTGNQPAAPQAAVQTPAPKGKPKPTNPADALKRPLEVLVTPTAPKSEPIALGGTTAPAEEKAAPKKAAPAKKAAAEKKPAEKKPAAKKEAKPKAEAAPKEEVKKKK